MNLSSPTPQLKTAEEAFVRACVDPEHPAYPFAARYLHTRRLKMFIAAVLDALGPVANAVAQKELLAALVAASIVVPICKTPSVPACIYWLKVRGGFRERHNPLEVLAGAHEEAVISHQTALIHYGLTTVRPLAWFVSTPPNARFNSPSLGQLEGLDLRTVALTSRLRFGTRHEWTDANEQVAIFDLERSLLGALDVPRLYGGTRSVLEAWEAGAPQLDESTMSDYLQQWNSPVLWRRAGLLAARFELAALQSTCASKVVSMMDVQMSQAPLFVGDPPIGVDREWNLTTPWIGSAARRG